MSRFWGFPGADDLAILVISGLSAACLFCALAFVRKY
jgi:hypothetical protein